VEGAEEGDEVGPAGRVAGHLDRGLDGLRAAVPEERPGSSAERRDPVELLAEPGVDRQVEVRGAEVEEVLGLLLDPPDDRRVRVTGRGDGDPGGEVQEEVAVDVLDGEALTANRDDRIGARQGGRGPGLVVGDVGPGERSGDLGDDVRDRPRAADRRGCCAHG
jgi:hypothetical protein